VRIGPEHGEGEESNSRATQVRHTLLGPRLVEERHPPGFMAGRFHGTARAL
jgi:hypothetical protein